MRTHPLWRAHDDMSRELTLTSHTIGAFHVSDSIRMTLTHKGVPMVNGLGVVFLLSHADLTRNDKDSRC
jgi:hypothetical protein